MAMATAVAGAWLEYFIYGSAPTVLPSCYTSIIILFVPLFPRQKPASGPTLYCDSRKPASGSASPLQVRGSECVMPALLWIYMFRYGFVNFFGSLCSLIIRLHHICWELGPNLLWCPALDLLYHSPLTGSGWCCCPRSDELPIKEYPP
jgi:hypothetical protein